jgi:hypothetical protein
MQACKSAHWSCDLLQSRAWLQPAEEDEFYTFHEQFQRVRATSKRYYGPSPNVGLSDEMSDLQGDWNQ